MTHYHTEDIMVDVLIVEDDHLNYHYDYYDHHYYNYYYHYY